MQTARRAVVLAAPEVAGADRHGLTRPSRRGDTVRIDVVVRTRKIGHFFPGGTVDSFDVWVELRPGRAGQADLPQRQGGGRRPGPVEPGAHFYRSLMLDGDGNPINKRNAWLTRSVAYVRLIPPGAADAVHYRFVGPPEAGERHHVGRSSTTASSPGSTRSWPTPGGATRPTGPAVRQGHDDSRWVFTGRHVAGVSGQVKGIPELPITVLAKAKPRCSFCPRCGPCPSRSRW